jgi:hypothetical protein
MKTKSKHKIAAVKLAVSDRIFYEKYNKNSNGGVWRIRTAHLLRAMQALYQMS